MTRFKNKSTVGPREVLLNDRALFEQITSHQQLMQAWKRVWRNGGASGADNVTVQKFSVNVVGHISALRRELRAGSYQPGLMRHVDIPKRAGSGLRRLSIPCVRDRIIQTSAAISLTPLLDAEFEEGSYGYRPNRSVNQAVARISLLQRQGFNWVVDADIEDYFDSIPHDGLMERWAQSVTDGPLSELMWTWLSHGAPLGRGVAQGSPLSPLLSNLYLDRMDEVFDARGVRLIRFADDFVVLCRSGKGADAAMEKVSKVLGEHGLCLNREKSQITDFDKGFRFLGHLFVRSMAMKVDPVTAEDSDIEKLLQRVAKEDSIAKQDALIEAEHMRLMEDRGYSPGLRNLYINAPDRRLSLRNQAFVVEQGHGGPTQETLWSELIAIPHQDIDRIDIGPKAIATDEAIRHGFATDTPIAYVNGHGETLGWVSDTLAPRAGRHLAQARITLDEGERLRLARILVEGRLRNQRAVLRRLLADRETPPDVVIDAIAGIGKVLGRGDTSRIRHAPSVEALMGYEGNATKGWWVAIGSLLDRDFTFKKRIRDRISNPSNIALNFLSWLLHRDISVAVNRAGLHPGFGALHSVSDRKDACVYDLMEEFRAHLIGGLFVYIANRNIIRIDMFSKTSDGYRLKSRGANALIKAYENRVGGKIKSPTTGNRVTWRRLMVEQAFSLAAHAEETRIYSPYEMAY